MSRFKSINYSRVVCEGCSAETIVLPGQEFSGLKCNCNGLKAKEISTPVQQELDYVKTQTVIVIGRFKDGDYEVCNGNNLDDTWRVPKDTFENTYEVQTDEIPTKAATDNKEDSLSKDGDPLAITLSLNDLKGLSVDEIKAKYNMDELRTLSKSVKIKGFSNMKEDKLVGKLLAKVD